MKRLGLIFLCLQCLFFAPVALTSDFEDALAELITNSNKEKARAIDALAIIDDERVLPSLKALLDARLYYRDEDKKLVYIDEIEDRLKITLVTSGEVLDITNKKTITKIRINNKLRRVLRANIAKLELTVKNDDLRLLSAQNLTKTPDPELREEIYRAIKSEKNIKVKSAMQLALAMIDIDSKDQTLRLNAMQTIGGSVAPEAVNVLNRLTLRDDSGKYLESNPEIVALAVKQLKDAKSKLRFYKVIEDFIFGLSLGSILLLAAIGLAITFGVMGVINMAHGEMIMLGAYTTFAVQQIFPNFIQYSLFIAIPAAFLVSGLVGVLIERLVIRHLYGRQLDTLLATFGISLILQQAVRMYSSNNVAVVSPDFISGFWQMNDAVAITYNRIYVLFFSLIVLGVLALMLKKTLLGLQMRAVTQDRPMANSMGIHSGYVDALTFGLGSGIAGIAGVALSQFTNVGPNLGQGYIIDSFMVVVFGGVGNLLGTFFGAMSLGIANKFLEPYTGAVIGKIIVLVFIILFIQWRPRGLFALKGRFVED
ncbi:urea ABC transporter permease subunit UrtB [Oceanicoccus sp. KOV_DT_Chl]|uniref:urea ABC transporter permease subunit UrtB n=1 Tax=Oceanicoccus sp. KOV_DT_Chl TaxID=1904639 RepID=UPI000C7E7B72|nr:urea ABC transporter permease subunit UrtB [Oceanicoccus sp. KOV_DT_Chl]